MSDHEIRTPFEEELLAGYLDGALTQQDEQRVRIQLESSEEVRQLLHELRMMREATMGTEFQTPEDRQWVEAGRTPASRGAWRIGFALLLAWGIVGSAYSLWKVNSEMTSWGERTLLWGGIASLAVLLFAALRDRLQAGRTDRYKGVEK